MDASGKRRARRIALIVLPLVLIGAAAYGAGYYLTEIPEKRAADYRAEAEPAFERVEAGMERTFAAWDSYGANSTIPRRKLREAKTFKESKKLLLPLYERTEQALDRIEAAIKTARGRIGRAEPVLADTPGGWLIDDKDPIKRADEAAELGADFNMRARRFLKSLAQFVRFERKAVDLRRRRIIAEAEHFPSADDLSLDEVREGLERTLTELERIDADARQLDPHRDLTALHRLDRAGDRFYIDYLEDALDAYQDLDQDLLESANERLRAHNRESRERFGRLYAKLRTESGLERATESLAERTDQVLDAIEAVTGSAQG